MSNFEPQLPPNKKAKVQEARENKEPEEEATTTTDETCRAPWFWLSAKESATGKPLKTTGELSDILRDSPSAWPNAKDGYSYHDLLHKFLTHGPSVLGVHPRLNLNCQPVPDEFFQSLSTFLAHQSRLGFHVPSDLMEVQFGKAEHLLRSSSSSSLDTVSNVLLVFNSVEGPQVFLMKLPFSPLALKELLLLRGADTFESHVQSIEDERDPAQRTSLTKELFSGIVSQVEESLQALKPNFNGKETPHLNCFASRFLQIYRKNDKFFHQNLELVIAPLVFFAVQGKDVLSNLCLKQRSYEEAETQLTPLLSNLIRKVAASSQQSLQQAREKIKEQL